jgi:nucleotide-binding universal stress UspA family protein
MHMKILLPVDGSDYTKRMLSYIAAHDELLGRGHEYTVFTAVPPVPPHAARFLDRNIVDDYYREQAEQVLRPVRAFADQQGWKIRTTHVPGHAAEAIAALAESENPDLIVMGTHGHSSLGNVILGSVASGVLARCKVPVLLIR